MALKPFEKWTNEALDTLLGYIRIYGDFAPLSDWLSATTPTVPDSALLAAEPLRMHLGLAVDSFNEDELKMQFIAPLLLIVNFTKFNKYRLFSQRKIGTMVTLVNGTADLLAGRVEAMVALGRQNPSHPYFFIHEYKPFSKSTPSDPLGQLVAAMIVAQIENADQKPIYGLYVMGQYWSFVTLIGKEYSQSRSYDATKLDDLKRILQALFWVKQYIEHRIDTDNV
ncbi:MAG: hypothetical protein RI894_2515 [Bacteroidota bacterium]|jgi:hypothetical protein